MLKYWDKELFLKINSLHTPFMDKVMWVISNDFFIYPFIVAFLYWYFKRSNGKRTAVLLLAIGFTVATSDLSTNLIKHSVKRYRPSHNLEIKDMVHSVNDYKGGQYGFFSSHASNAFAITILFFMSASFFIQRKWRLMFFILPLLIGYSRIYLGVHYPFDIICGAINGMLVGILVFVIIQKFFNDSHAPSKV
ncbi:MAG: phosphatase PAP2 family protein [Sphingobacteriaceae bacterium]